MDAKFILALADSLKASRPVDIYINDALRSQWYKDVSAVSLVLAEQFLVFNAEAFFNRCGVPT